MVLMSASVFLLNVFCSLVPCEPNFGDPKIPPSPHGRLKTRSHETSFPGMTPDGFFDPPTVFTYSGGVEGYLMRIINGRQIYAFEGIPYATAKRFQVN